MDLTTPGTILFDPKALGLDPDGDNIYHFTTINIVRGVTVKLSGRKINGPVFWLAQGDVTISGTVDLDGEDGMSVNVTPYINPASRIPAYPGAGGYPGGVGAYDPNNLAQEGGGPGGGRTRTASWGGGGSYGSSAASSCSNSLAGNTYGNNFLVPSGGGSGGGGGERNTGNSRCQGGGGGGGGGAILIASSTSISFDTLGASTSYSIRALGAFPGTGNCGGGGGEWPGGWGSGGAVRIVAPTVKMKGGVAAIGVERTSSDYYNYNAFWNFTSCGHGLDNLGGAGRIRIEALTFPNGLPSVFGPVTFGAPSNLFLPTQQPSLAAISVDGSPVAVSPNGNFNFPDTTINNASPVKVDIAAKFIPLGTIVKLYVYSENGPDQTINSSPLTGTLAASTATATVTLPPGFSRGFLRAVWTP
ncbi:MAG: hypothetical protein ACRERU_22005 [Methylococcales bacterium]